MKLEPLKFVAAIVLSLAAWPGWAHHGIAGIGVAGLQGPGAPIESAASTLLPEGKTLAYFKVDDARYRTFAWAAPNARYSRFTMAGLGYGFTPWFSGYAFLPYHEKVDESGGLDSRGFADVSLMGQFGFKYDREFQLIPANESLDDLEDWHFSIFGGASLPTGDPNSRLRDGTIDPSRSLGFGKPAYTIGLTASKTLLERFTLNLEASILRFQEYRYADGERVRFGSEHRLNVALSYRGLVVPEQMFRMDPVLELQYLGLGRDREGGVPAIAAGGRMLYAVPGVRAYWRNTSLAVGVKIPVWTRLNEGEQQQGAEGKERYRMIVSASALF